MTAILSKAPPLSLFKLSVDQWTKPFWDACAQHRLVAARCGACGAFRMPPSPFCPECRSQSLDWPELSGQGIVYSFTIVSRATVPEMEICLPYVPALITLPDAGNVRLVSNIVDAPLDKIEIGAAVHVVWQDGEGGIALPRFRLDEERASS